MIKDFNVNGSLLPLVTLWDTTSVSGEAGPVQFARSPIPVSLSVPTKRLVTLGPMAEGSSDRRSRYDEIDVTSGEETQGTKPKRWLFKPTTEERWLMKEATFNVTRDGVRYRKGDDWAERIAYGVAVVLGLPAAQVELSVSRLDTTVYGTICRSVLKDPEPWFLGMLCWPTTASS